LNESKNQNSNENSISKFLRKNLIEIEILLQLIDQ